jgi:hypothetical protein
MFASCVRETCVMNREQACVDVSHGVFPTDQILDAFLSLRTSYMVELLKIVASGDPGNSIRNLSE